jgi:hypothetical protein
MTFSIDEFQKLIGILALGVGGLYILGGFIVNLHLSRFGVTEYRLLKAKYLAVGLQFLFGSSIVMGLIFIFNLIVPIRTLQDLQIRLIVSLIFLLLSTLAYYNQKFHAQIKHFWVKFLRQSEEAAVFHTWSLMMFGMGLFPISLAVSYNSINIITANTEYLHLFILMGLLDGIAGFALVILYFGVELYANPVPMGPEAADFIGTGKMQKVQFVGKSEDIELIKQLGIPLETHCRTTELGLLDETDDYYLVVIYKGEEGKAIKIHRELIKGIAYHGKQ